MRAEVEVMLVGDKKEVNEDKREYVTDAMIAQAISPARAIELTRCDVDRAPKPVIETLPPS